MRVASRRPIVDGTSASASPLRVASRRIGFNVATEDQSAVQVWDCWDMAAWTSRGRDEVTAHIADGVAIRSAARDGIATLNADGDGTAVDRERKPIGYLNDWRSRRNSPVLLTRGRSRRRRRR